MGAVCTFSPVVGGLIVVFLVKNFAPEAKGHGVPEVMDSIFYKGGAFAESSPLSNRLPQLFLLEQEPRSDVKDPLSRLALRWARARRALGLSTSQKITLIAAGAGAGIAATFNTPLGGVLFATEILLPEISSRTFLPVIISTGAATYVGRVLLGASPAFIMPLMDNSPLAGASPRDFLLVSAIGLACGVVAWLFIVSLAFCEDFFPKLPGGAYVQAAIGMGTVGIMMVAFTQFYGLPFVNGVGYGVI